MSSVVRLGATTNGTYAGSILPVALVDLLWLGGVVWSVSSLVLTGDGEVARLVLMAIGCYVLASASTALVTWRAPGSRVARLALLGLAVLAPVVGTWWALHSGLALIGTDWLARVLQSLAQAPYAWPPELVALPAAVAFYWRGYWVARQLPPPEAVGRSFQAGLVALAFLSATVPGQSQGAWSLYALFYLGVGLAMLALARGSGLPRLGRTRIGGLAAAAIVVAGTAALAAFAVWFAPLLLGAITFVFGLFWAAFNAMMAWLSNFFGSPPSHALPPGEVGQTSPMDRETIRNIFHLSDEVRRIGGYAVYASFLFPFLYAIVRYLSEVWRRLRDASYLAEVRVESVDERGSLWRWLLGLFGQLDRWLWRRMGGRPLDGNPAAWPVRLVYRDLLKAAKKRGAARGPAVTSSEYVAIVSSAYPDHGEDLMALTRAYERARYGPRVEAVDVGALREVCRRVTRRRWWRPGKSQA